MNILSECEIVNQEIILNGKLLFSDKKNDAASFLVSAYRFLGYHYPKFFKMDNLSKLAFLGIENLIAGVHRIEETENMTIIMFNSSSSLNVDEKFQHSLETIPSPSLFVYTLPNVMIGEICIRHKIYGENYLFITEGYNREEQLKVVQNLTKFTDSNKILLGYADYQLTAEGHFMLLEK